MDDDELASFQKKPDALHQRATISCPIARMHIDVQRP